MLSKEAQNILADAIQILRDPNRWCQGAAFILKDGINWIGAAGGH